jgi:hypothetical protein
VYCLYQLLNSLLQEMMGKNTIDFLMNCFDKNKK